MTGQHNSVLVFVLLVVASNSMNISALNSDRAQLAPPMRPSFYLIGRVHHPGLYPVEPGMTVSDAITGAGGIEPRRTADAMPVSVTIRRKSAKGLQVVSAKMSDAVFADDLVIVRRGKPKKD